MKTKEFLSATRGLGFNIRENHVEIVITDVRDYEVCSVSKLNCFSINTRGSVFLNLGSDVKEKLLTYLYEYAKTPLEEREEEEKYLYKFPFNVIYETKKDLYVFKILDGGLNLSNAEVHDPKVNNRYHFTDKEVEKFAGKDRALFNVCEKIEVTSND